MGRNWTDQEDTILREMVGKHGKQWATIAAALPNRSASQVAARWEKCLDPALTKGPFTAEEDNLIVQFVSTYGPRSWPRISELLPNRSSKQCRERWFNHLDPSINKSPWTPEEDQIIFQQHLKIGGKWSTIAKMVPGRSDNAIKNRWNSSISKRVQVNEQGEQYILPDSSKRHYNSSKTKKERPPPIMTAPPIPTLQIEEENSGIAKTPPIENGPPTLSPASSQFYGFGLTPVGIDNNLFSPNFPTTPGGFGSLLSPMTPGTPGFLQSPLSPAGTIKPEPDENTKG